MEPETDWKKINALKAIIIFAGERDRLSWWDDWSMTSVGDEILGRLFPRSGPDAAIRLGMLSATRRHSGVLQNVGVDDGMTLFDLRLGSDDEFMVAPFDPSYLPIEEIRDTPSLRSHLERVLEGLLPSIDGAVTDGFGAVDLTGYLPQDSESPLATAAVLCAGYILGERGRTVIPYYRKGASRSMWCR